MRIFVDADGCPVKHEIFRVALRQGVRTTLVSNAPLDRPTHELFDAQVVTGAFNAADDWIAATAGPDDIVVTADIPLAERCLAAGAAAIGHRGGRFDERSIGEAVAMRDLMSMLRQTGEVRGGPPPFSARDRSNFLSQLDQTIVALRRRNARRTPPQEPQDIN